jgi:predicted ArsR family transcriptional regulator
MSASTVNTISRIQAGKAALPGKGDRPGKRAQRGKSAGFHQNKGFNPNTGQKPDTGLSDATIIDYLRNHPMVSVADLVEFTGVTATAVRQRLGRLMDQGWVVRRTRRAESAERASTGRARRGRPTYRYSLTRAGNRSSGSNYEDLANVLWSEIRAIQDPKIRRGLLQRIATRLVENYRDQVEGATLRERMNSLVVLMETRAIPFEVGVITDKTASSGTLPTLMALACPYPDLAEQDRMICALEKMLFSEILGEGLRLTSCRLDGDTCCTFEAHARITGKN